MCEQYDIIEWKSCESISTRSAEITTEDQKQIRYHFGSYPFSRDGICSTNFILFPKLFMEDPESDQSGIISMADIEYYGPLDYLKEKPPDELEVQSVYQKVSSWVMSQRKYFLHSEPSILIEDDELEVIDPVDLFHEKILDDYCLITENDCERRTVFRELKNDHYEIESIEEAMKTNEYKFLRKPEGNIEIELKPLIHFHHLYREANTLKRKRKDSSSTISVSLSSSSSCEVEREEESIAFLGVPRLLENYIILNREGGIVKPDNETDLWLQPLKEELSVEEQPPDSHEEMEFLSSWFSDVYQDLNTDENRTLVTDKVTVISSVTHCTDEEVWVDAPEIPHWLEGENQADLELFNQPSRPLYYYRDRIKGCYRIIGVEDETVVLFSGNDDDTIFYNEDEDDFKITKTFPEPRVTRNIYKEVKRDKQVRPIPYRRNTRRSSNDRKNDSGIEDIEDIVGEEVAVASFSLTDKEAQKLGYKTCQVKSNSWKLGQRLMTANETVLDWILIFILGMAVMVLIVVCTVKDTELHFRPNDVVKNLKFVQEDFHNFCHKLIMTLKTRFRFMNLY